MIYTRRGSLKREFGKKEFEASHILNRKRNSTGSALANIKYAHKISNANNRKFSSNIRSGSAEESKPTFGVRECHKVKIFCIAAIMNINEVLCIFLLECNILIIINMPGIVKGKEEIISTINDA